MAAETILFSGNLRRDPVVHLNSHPISRVTQLDNKQRFDQPKSEMILQGLRLQVRKKWDSPPLTLHTIYDQAVTTILCYGIKF